MIPILASIVVVALIVRAFIERSSLFGGLALLVAFIGFCLIASAHAAEVNFGTVLIDQDDKPIMDGDKQLTLGRAAMVALMSPQPDEQTLPADEKLRKGKLALKVYANGVLDLSVEDIALVKKYIGKTYGSLVVVRAFPLLDPRP